MSTVEYRFLEPLDVLFLRGNKLFGDPGSYGESLIPPWPSVAAGALRSRILADDGLDPSAFARGEKPHATLGTPKQPGTFRVTSFHLARRFPDPDLGGKVEILMQPPADLVISEREDGVALASTLSPTRLQAGLTCSAPLPLVPVLAEDTRSKPASGYWLTASGWDKYLKGDAIDPDADLIKSSRLWAIDPRVGVGLDTEQRRAADGRLFSVQAVAMAKPGNPTSTDKHSNKPDFATGFLVGVTGADVPKSGMLRLGGDGRAAALQAVDLRPPEPDYEAIAAAGRCRLVLTSPGIFTLPVSSAETPQAGWLPFGSSRSDDGAVCFDLHGVRGKLVCAAVPRAEVVSGWDLAKWQPKAAQRAAPTGSVYWLTDLETTPEALRKLAETGLWPEAAQNTARRAEGFNCVAIAAWRAV